MLSQTYQMSSRAENAKAGEVDPGNDLLWRQNLRRLEAEALRDTLLAVSGKLNPKMGGRGFFPRLSGEVLAGQSRPGLDWEISNPEELSRRSLYAYVRRTMSVPMLDAFDYSNTTSPLSERPVTTVAPQSLLMLNDEFLQQQAAAFADRLEKEWGKNLRRVEKLARPHPNPLPQEREKTAALRKDLSVSANGANVSENTVSLRSTNAKDGANGSPSPGAAGEASALELSKPRRGEGGSTTSFARSQIEAFIQRGFQFAVGREPTRRERELSRDYINRQQKSFAALRTRLTFQPDVPTSLYIDYMSRLRPDQFLIGPKAGWSYHQGRWSAAYESIRSVERDRGPFAFSTAANFSNGFVEAKIFLHTACESAGLFFRATAKDNEAHGYEVALEPREQRIVLRRHAGELTTLAQVSAEIPTARSLPLTIQATDARIRVWLGDNASPVIDFTDPNPLLAFGQVGARAWGAALSIDDLVLRPDGAASMVVRDEERASPERRAREAFCLLLLNLNEVVYVD